MKIGRIPTPAPVMWICSPSLTTDRLVRPYREDIFATIIDAYAHHLDAPREVHVLLSDRTMQTWDSLFRNLARDRVLLYTRGSLPAPLAA
jgi:hypothetical protein